MSFADVLWLCALLTSALIGLIVFDGSYLVCAPSPSDLIRPDGRSGNWILTPIMRRES